MIAVSLIGTPNVQTYKELVYLAGFYRWSASKSNNATESRSPLNGQRFTNANGYHHHNAYKAGEKAMAKAYLQRAAMLRKEIQKIYS